MEPNRLTKMIYLFWHRHMPITIKLSINVYGWFRMYNSYRTYIKSNIPREQRLFFIQFESVMGHPGVDVCHRRGKCLQCFIYIGWKPSYDQMLCSYNERCLQQIECRLRSQSARKHIPARGQPNSCWIEMTFCVFLLWWSSLQCVIQTSGVQRNRLLSYLTLWDIRIRRSVVSNAVDRSSDNSKAPLIYDKQLFQYFFQENSDWQLVY